MCKWENDKCVNGKCVNTKCVNGKCAKTNVWITLFKLKTDN